MRPALSARLSLAAALVTTFAACAIPDAGFTAAIDGGAATGPADAREDAAPAKPTIVVDTTSLMVKENESVELEVSLGAAPTGSFTVSIAAPSELALDETALTFTATDYAVPQTVTITAQYDANTRDSSVRLTLTAIDTADVAVAVVVDDIDELLLIANKTSVDVGEAGTAEVRVRLSAEPGGDQVVTATVGNTGAATVSPSSRTFNDANWNEEFSFTISGVDDPNAADDDTAVTFASTGVPNKAVGIKTIDNDSQNIQVEPGSLTVDEGATRGINLFLSQQPSRDVQVTLTASSGDVTLSRTQVPFTTTDYASPHLVNITAATDQDTANENVTITMTLNEPIRTRNFAVTVNDLNRQSIRTSAGSRIDVDEGGTESFDVFLAFQPGGDVTVNLSSNNTSAATISPRTITFNATTWSNRIPVTVTGIDDLDLGNGSALLRLTATGLDAVEIPTTVDDDDLQALVVPGSISVVESMTNSFTVGLAFRPDGDTVVDVSSGLTSAVVVESGSRLVFLPSNYQTPQTVTLRAPWDANTAHETAQIRVAGAGLERSVTATVEDRTQPAHYGWPDFFDFHNTFARRTAFAFQLQPVTANMAITSLEVQVMGAGPQARMAIYEGTTGADPRPTGAPVVTAGPFALVPRPAVSSIAASGTLVAGRTYWIVVVFDVVADVASGSPSNAGQNGTRCEISMGFAVSWPDFALANCNRGELFNVAVRGVR